MKPYILPIVLLIFFSGCVIKEKNQTTANTDGFNNTNRFNVPNMNQQNRYSNEKYFLPNDSIPRSKGDSELKKLIEEKPPVEQSYSKVKDPMSELDTSCVKVENESTIPSNKKLNEYSNGLDTKNIVIPENEINRTKMAEELEENVVHVKMQGDYNGYVYPVSMRKKAPAETPQKESEKKEEPKVEETKVEVAPVTQAVAETKTVEKESIIEPITNKTEGDK